MNFKRPNNLFSLVPRYYGHKISPEVVRNNGNRLYLEARLAGQWMKEQGIINLRVKHTREVLRGITSGSFRSAEDERTRNNGFACLVLDLYMWWLGCLSSG